MNKVYDDLVDLFFISLLLALALVQLGALIWKYNRLKSEEVNTQDSIVVESTLEIEE